MSPHELNTLIQEKKVQRILQPILYEHIKKVAEIYDDEQKYIIQYQGEFYLSLQGIQDSQQRAHIYDLVQSLQLGKSVDLRVLPQPLHHLLQPGSSRMRHMTIAWVLGAGIGIICGVLGAAIAVLIGMVIGVDNESLVAILLAPLAFMFCSFFGWVISASVIWYKLKPDAQIISDTIKNYFLPVFY